MFGGSNEAMRMLSSVMLGYVLMRVLFSRDPYQCTVNCDDIVGKNPFCSFFALYSELVENRGRPRSSETRFGKNFWGPKL